MDRTVKIIAVLAAIVLCLCAQVPLPSPVQSGSGTSLPYSSTGGTNNLVSRDANGNTFINNELSGTTGNACSGTITLTVASTRVQVFTSGSGTCTVVMPDATTLLNGWSFELNNNATGNLTIEANGGGTLTTAPAGSYARMFLLSNSMSAGQWDYHWFLPSAIGWGTASVPTSAAVAGTNSSKAFVAATQSSINSLSYAAGGGTANAQTVTLSPAITAYAAGLTVSWLPTAANTTTTPTLNVNGVGAATIIKVGGAALVANDLTTTAVATAIYDGTYFELQSPQTSVSAIGATSHEWINSISTAGVPNQTQPACGDLSNSSGGCSMSTTAGGDLSGTLPSPTVAKVNGGSVPASAAVVGTNSSSQPVAATTSAVAGLAYAAGGGTANAQTVTLSPAVASYAAGLEVNWLPTAANTTTTPTLNVNSVAAKTIIKVGGAALAANDLTTTAVAKAIYDGTYFELQNPQTSSAYLGPTNQTQATCAIGTTYQNTNAQAMFVSIAIYDDNASGASALQVQSDSSSTPTTVVAKWKNATTTEFVETTISFVVLANNYFKLVNEGNTPAVDYCLQWH